MSNSGNVSDGIAQSIAKSISLSITLNGGVLSKGKPFRMIITSPTVPTVKDVTGGAITIDDNGDGTFTAWSDDDITHFAMDGNKADITKIHILKAFTVTSLNTTFKGLSAMEHFSWRGYCNVNDFRETWDGCSSLTTFPYIDTSKGTDFFGTWGGCIKLACFIKLDFTASTVRTNTFAGCVKLVYPEALGTTVRSSNNALKGVWTNTISCDCDTSIGGLDGTHYDLTGTLKEKCIIFKQ